jgi:hypothetical protein
VLITITAFLELQAEVHLTGTGFLQQQSMIETLLGLVQMVKTMEPYPMLGHIAKTMEILVLVATLHMRVDTHTHILEQLVVHLETILTILHQTPLAMGLLTQTYSHISFSITLSRPSV